MSSSPDHSLLARSRSLARSSKRRLLARVLVVLVLVLPCVASGAPPESLHVEVEGDAESAEAIVEAIARELDLPLDDSGPTLHLSLDGATATMTFMDPERGNVERTIQLPPLEHERIEVLALLAGNLARDQLFDVTSAESSVAAAPASPAAASASVRDEPKELPTSKESSDRDKQATNTEAHDQLAHYPANFALLSPLEVMPGAAQRRLAFELGLLFGRVGASVGVRIEGLVGVSRFEAHGLSIGGLWLETGTSAKGLGIAGLVSRSGKGAFGFHVGGLAALAAEQARGVQLGGILTRTDELRGVQVGLVNVAEKVRGAQVGVFNFAREVRGAQVGLVNVAGDARYQAVGWFDEQASVHAGARVMWGELFGVLALGVDPQGFAPEGQLSAGSAHLPLAFSTGLGGRMKLPALGRWMLELDLLYSIELSTNGSGALAQALRQRASIGYAVSDSVTVVAGGGIKERWIDDSGGTFELGPTFFAGVQLW